MGLKHWLAHRLHLNTLVIRDDYVHCTGCAWSESLSLPAGLCWGDMTDSVSLEDMLAWWERAKELNDTNAPSSYTPPTERDLAGLHKGGGADAFNIADASPYFTELEHSILKQEILDVVAERPLCPGHVTLLLEKHLGPLGEQFTYLIVELLQTHVIAYGDDPNGCTQCHRAQAIQPVMRSESLQQQLKASMAAYERGEAGKPWEQIVPAPRRED